MVGYSKPMTGYSKADDRALRGLDCCINGSCAFCPFNDFSDDVDSCEYELMEAALDRLKVLSARLVSLTNIMRKMNVPLWMERRFAHDDEKGNWIIPRMISVDGMMVYLPADSMELHEANLAEYGASWRCWTRMPEDSQTEGAEWDAI